MRRMPGKAYRWCVVVGLMCAPGAALAQQSAIPLEQDPPAEAASSSNEAQLEEIRRSRSLEAESGASVEPEVLTRGPVHEAFAEQVALDPEPGIIVSDQPPVPVNEIPPEVKPDDENVVWIQGYWGWDDERQDYIWISGVWRAVPPGRRWVPGYWTEVEDGWQWISGFWASAEVGRLEYYDPPESLEYGPASPPPSEDYFWVPGCWIYRYGDYHWRPGYWYPYQQNWVWIPSRYVWTPAGALFCDGYWDYRLPLRGMLFAPVYFPSYRYGYWPRDYYYSPHHVIDTVRLLLHLFVRPSYRHYYFGDYYGLPYAGRRIIPWYDYYRRWGYDPLFVYYRTQYGLSDIDYSDRMERWYRYFDRNEQARPPRNWVAQEARLGQRGEVEVRDESILGRRLQDVILERPGRERDVARLTIDERRGIGREAEQARELLRERQRIEAPGQRDAARDPLERTAGAGQQRAALRLPDDRFVENQRRRAREAASRVGEDRTFQRGPVAADGDGRPRRDLVPEQARGQRPDPDVPGRRGADRVGLPGQQEARSADDWEPAVPGRQPRRPFEVRSRAADPERAAAPSVPMRDRSGGPPRARSSQDGPSQPALRGDRGSGQPLFRGEGDGGPGPGSLRGGSGRGGAENVFRGGGGRGASPSAFGGGGERRPGAGAARGERSRGRGQERGRGRRD